MQLARLAAECREIGCVTEENAPMARMTSFKIGGPADLLITAPDEPAAATALGLCREAGAPVLFLGNGTNLLVRDEGVRGVVLRFDPTAGAPRREENRLRCPAGVPLKQLCRFARDQRLSGLEFAYGIPGTVGGAVFMNAGAYGGQMEDVLVSARAVYPDGTVREITADRMALGYRHSVFMDDGAVIAEATMELIPDDRETVGARMEEFLRRRREKQPLEYPSAGSFFKRPTGQYAGALIESCGLKGAAVGGAQVSEKHAGFLINRGGATCDEMLRLAERVSDTVWARYGVRLEREVRVVGGA